MGILDLRGPEFLLLYVCLFVAAIAVGVYVRRRIGPSADAAPPDADKLDPYELAYMTGGARLAINSAVASLYRREAIQVDRTKREVGVGAQSPAGAPKFELAVYDFIKQRKQVPIRELHKNISTDLISARLEHMNLVHDSGRRTTVGLMGVLPLLFLMASGLAKVAVGVSRNRPVAFLVVLLVISLVAVIIVAATTPLRTRAGDAVLKGLQQRYDALRATATTKPDSLPIGQFALAMALFGPVVLAASPLYEDLRRTLLPPNAGASCSGSCGGGSSCGGGGGGCGGGGCGGGGCGGCGGGD